MSRGRRRDFPSGFSISARRLRKDTHPPDLITSQAPGACRAPSRCQQETVSPASGTQTSDRGLATLDLQEAAAHSPAARRTRAFTGVGFSPSFSANRRSVRPVGSKQGPPREKARQPRARRSSRRCASVQLRPRHEFFRALPAAVSVTYRDTSVPFPGVRASGSQAAAQ